MTPGPSSRAVPEGAAERLLAGRYRLLEERTAPTSAGRLWHGRDETLARAVAIRTVALSDPRAAALLAAAADAGRLAHPALTQVYDAADQDGFAYVVREWASGQPLAALLALGPLDGAQAQLLLGDVADALRAAHAAGIGHGRLHPGNVVVADDGAVKVTDLAVAAALSGASRDEQTDAAALGRLGYAALTGRWVGASPDESWGDLTAAPWSGGRPCTARQVRAAVPRPLDAVVTRALAATGSGGRPRVEPLSTPAAVARALHELPRPTAVRELRELNPAALRRRRLLRRASALAALSAVGVVAYLTGRSIGAVPGEGRFSALQRTPSPTPGASAPGVPISLDPRAIRDFDPQGDGSENPTEAQLAVDGDPTTGWHTALYKNRADLGGLKSGVGLLVDLGRPVEVRQVVVSFLKPGADVEIRAGDRAPTKETDLAVVAEASRVKDVATLRPRAGSTTARYWLVWLRRLPRDGSGFRAAIGEVQLRP